MCCFKNHGPGHRDPGGVKLTVKQVDLKVRLQRRNPAETVAWLTFNCSAAARKLPKLATVTNVSKKRVFTKSLYFFVSVAKEEGNPARR